MLKIIKAAVVIGLVCLNCGKTVPTQSTQISKTNQHNNNITEDEVWRADSIHVVGAAIYVQNAILEIEPGAVIQLKTNASINIMGSGGIVADGSTNQITFTREVSSQPNWKYIYFASNANHEQCKLISCKFEWGGSDAHWSAAIYCNNAAPTIRNCTITNSATAGICFLGDCSSAIFDSNTVAQNTSFPIMTSVKNVPILSNGNYNGNGMDCIRIIDGTVDQDIQFDNFGIPFQIADVLSISNATLTISSQNILKFEPETGITVKENGVLIAHGNYQQPITFTAVDPSNKHWDCIYFDKGSTGELTDCIIEYGGSGRPANIYIDQASPSISNCEIRKSSAYGMYIKGEFTPALFSNNVITANKFAAVSASAASVPYLYGNIYAGNGDDAIEVRGGSVDGIINKTGKWEYIGLPGYRIKDDLKIQLATLFIASGVTLELEQHAQIEVGAGGGLIADGAASLITITGSHKDPGFWDGIYFSNSCNESGCLLNYCMIQYGGGNFSRPANIYCDNSSPTIANCYIQYSRGYGIYLNGIANPTLINNDFSNNISGAKYP